MILTAKKKRKGDCMMFNSLAEKEISFKELEKKVFKYVCELGCEITKMREYEGTYKACIERNKNGNFIFVCFI